MPKRLHNRGSRAILATADVYLVYRVRQAERTAPLRPRVARVGLALLVGLSALVGRRALVGLLLLASFGTLTKARRVLGPVAFASIAHPPGWLPLPLHTIPATDLILHRILIYSPRCPTALTPL